MHRDFHSGLSQPANDTSNNEIYGVVPYIAPEIFNGDSFSKASDIYSLGMIMWEFTTGFKPFANVEHNTELIIEIIDGKRPEITEDTPECYANLMKRCWNSDPSKRPSIIEVRRTVGNWYHKKTNSEQFNKADLKRLELIKLEKLGPKFAIMHPKAIYTSRELGSLISKISSMKGNISKKLEFELYDNSCQSSNTQFPYASISLNTHMKIQHQNVIMGISENLRKRNIEELESKSQVNSKQRHHIKTADEVSEFATFEGIKYINSLDFI
ncbi:2675_t:CDS:2 [Funneliformis geosporum]|nr:2675_t:CDS:2 [Funneliformis geosporum]